MTSPNSPRTGSTWTLTVAGLVCAALLAAACGGDATTGVVEETGPDDATPAQADEAVGAVAARDDTAAGDDTAPVDETTGLETLRVGTSANPIVAGALVGMREDAATALDGLVEEVEFVSVETPDEMRAEIAAGRVDVVLVPTNVAANLSGQGLPVELLGVFELPLMHVLGPSGLAGDGWRALADRELHVPFRGDILDLAVQALAPENGLAVGEDLTMTYYASSPEIVAAMLQGRAELVLLPEPLASVALARAADAGVDLTRLIDIATEWQSAFGTALVTPSFVVRRELAEQHPDVVEAVRASMASSVADTVARADEVGPELAAVAQLPPPIVAEALARLAPSFSPSTERRADIEAYLDVLFGVSPDSIGGALPDDAFYG